jgi:opacity protein-like surface antigen
MSKYREGALAVALVLVHAAPSAAQTYDWQHRWYWGAKAGMLSYSLPSSGQVFSPQFGGEWLITARRSALYVGYSQSVTAESEAGYVLAGQTGTYTVDFDNMRRLQIGVVVLPTNGTLQPYLGGGFVIETLGNARITTPAAPTQAQQRALADASSGGFALIIAGIQLRMGSKMALYAHYQGSPQGRDFLLAGSSHSFEAGIRYAFMPSREQDPTTRR